MLAGCPWVSFIDHEANQKLLLGSVEPDGDVDADADTDVDTDTDADTDPVCVDDSFEPNGNLLTATEVLPPDIMQAVMCPEDLAPLTGGPLDLFEVEVGPDEVLSVLLDDRSTTTCDTMTMSLQITDEAGTVYPGAQALGGCPRLNAGWGAGTYVVWVGQDLPTVEQRYRLDVSLVQCRDNDSDGFLAASCGGPDCSDLEASRYPGATDLQDGVDQDCDGGDDMEDQGCTVTVGATFQLGTLSCSDPQLWDRWTVPAVGGVPLSVVVQNGAVGAADPIAFVVDPDGTSHYGLQPDGSQMDDEQICDTPPWNGGACPAGCIHPTRDGLASIWVAQRTGTGCVGDADYKLLIYVDGVPAVPTQVLDNGPLAFP